jgi:hypothetical protein
VAVFFLLGYIIVESFINALEFQGMFWFSDAFYARAGSRFLLDIARSVLFHPILAVTAGFGVWVLIRASARLCTWADRFRPGCETQCRDMGMIVLALLFSLLLLSYDMFFDPWLSMDKLIAHLGEEKSIHVNILIFLLEWVPRYDMLLPKPAVWLYVNLFLPVAVLLGRDLLRTIIQARTSRSIDQDSGSLENATRRTKGPYLMWAAFIIYTILFVYGYGHYIYDWRVAQLTMPTAHQLEYGDSVSADSTSGFGKPSDTVDTVNELLPLVHEPTVYLVAHINEAYFFWIQDSELDVGRIVSSRHDKVDAVSFPLRQNLSLRKLTNERRVASRDNLKALTSRKNSKKRQEEDHEL